MTSGTLLYAQSVPGVLSGSAAASSLDVRDWVLEGHLALFVHGVVATLDLEPIFSAYEQGDGRGKPPYPPRMMVALLLYAYCVGIPSSRKIEAATYTDVGFRVLTAF